MAPVVAKNPEKIPGQEPRKPLKNYMFVPFEEQGLEEVAEIETDRASLKA